MNANSKLVEVLTVAHVDTEGHVGNSLLQILKLRFGHEVKFYDQTSASKSAGKTVALTILIINIGNSNNLNKF